MNIYEKNRENIYSNIGKWYGGVDVIIENMSLTKEIMGNLSLMQLQVLNSTGKLVNKNVADWLEIRIQGVSYPDPRIWFNFITTLAADVKTTPPAAVSIGVMSSDSRNYGGSQTTFNCMIFLINALKDYKNNISIGDIVNKYGKFNNNGIPSIVGFSRPVDLKDERIEPYTKFQKELNIPFGDYQDFSFKLSEYLDFNYKFRINNGGYSAAFLLDQGFTPEEGYKLLSYCVINGTIACYRDYENRPVNSFLPLKCEDIIYIGVEKRSIK